MHGGARRSRAVCQLRGSRFPRGACDRRRALCATSQVRRREGPEGRDCTLLLRGELVPPPPLSLSVSPGCAACAPCFCTGCTVAHARASCARLSVARTAIRGEWATMEGDRSVAGFGERALGLSPPSTPAAALSRGRSHGLRPRGHRRVAARIASAAAVLRSGWRGIAVLLQEVWERGHERPPSSTHCAVATIVFRVRFCGNIDEARGRTASCRRAGCV